MRWFGASLRRATPKGQDPSTLAQHRIKDPSYIGLSLRSGHSCAPRGEPELALGGVHRRDAPVRQAPSHLHAGAGLDEGVAVQHGPDRVDGRAGQVGEVEGLFADLAVLAVGPAQDTEQQSEPA